MPRRRPRHQPTDAAGRCPVHPPGASHDRLRLALMDAGRAVRAAAEDPVRFTAARDALARFCVTELLPHLETDERWLSEAGRCPEAALLVAAIRAETRAMRAAVQDVAQAAGPCEVVAATRVLHVLLATHDHHERLIAEVDQSQGAAIG